MREQTIKKYVDKKILRLLRDKVEGYMVRTEIRQSIRKFENNLKEMELKIEPDLNKILSMDNKRAMYLNMTIYFMQKRLDLTYSIEIKDWMGYSPYKKYKIYLLKEHLLGDIDYLSEINEI
jgi:hypothetical protein